MDLSKENNQKSVMRQALSDQGFETEDIGKEIERLENYGDLESVATRHHKVLVKKEAVKKTIKKSKQMGVTREFNVAKKCKSCLLEKDNSQFYAKRNGKYGTRAHCMSCSKNNRVPRTREQTVKYMEAQKYRRHNDIYAKISQLCWRSKARAKKSGIGHTITPDFLKELYTGQGEICAMTGREFNLTPYHSDGISLDRID